MWNLSPIQQGTSTNRDLSQRIDEKLISPEDHVETSSNTLQTRHFEEWFELQPLNQEEDLLQNNKNTYNNEWPITTDMVKRILPKLKNRKAPELDKITNQMLKESLLRNCVFYFRLLHTRK